MNDIHLSRLSKLLITIIIAGFFSVVGYNPVHSQNKTILPQPLEYHVLPGEFQLNKKKQLLYNTIELESLVKHLQSMIQSRAEIDLKIAGGPHKKKDSSIYLSLDTISWGGHLEGYQLLITSKNVEITAGTEQGLFYGIQTLIQLVDNSQHGRLQAVEIRDEPRFQWRGLMLDVSRHFFTIEEVKKLIDQMVAYKFNTLQLHLTDDQGWRMEIKSLPELTRIGAWRAPRFGLWWDRQPTGENEPATYGGDYTQEEIRDLVAYASSRYIRILPEIDIPGHSLAAIAAYPWLSTTKGKYKVNPGSQFYTVEDNALSPISEETYQFLDKVFTEVANLFPFEYIHIGGDECYKGFWEKDPATVAFMKEQGIKDVLGLQSYFIKRVEKILHAKGKRMIGWDEILEGGLAPDATVMSWRGMQGGIAAANAGHQVIMSPNNHAYLDLYQGDPAVEPPTYSMLRLKTVYAFDPLPDQKNPDLILGGQGNLWSESIPSFRHAEYMLWPRAMALSEVLWSDPSKKEWDGFIHRTEKHLLRYRERGINFATSMYDAIIIPLLDQQENLKIRIETEVNGLEIYYTFNNTLPDQTQSKYVSGELLSPLTDADTFRVITYREGKPIGKLITVSLAELRKRATQQ